MGGPKRVRKTIHICSICGSFLIWRSPNYIRKFPHNEKWEIALRTNCGPRIFVLVSGDSVLHKMNQQYNTIMLDAGGTVGSKVE